MRLAPERCEQLVRAAELGDRASWEELVEAYAGLVSAIIRNHRLSGSDASDVSQTAWLRLVENIGRLQDRSRVGAWLATTTRRECLRVLSQGRRLVLHGDVTEYETWAPDTPGPDAGLLAAERDGELHAALARLSPRCQQLLNLLMLDPPPSYEEVSAALGMPIGSIGPTRGRCLARLSEILGERGTAEVADRSPE